MGGAPTQRRCTSGPQERDDAMRTRWNPFRPQPKRRREIEYASERFRKGGIGDRPRSASDLVRLVRVYLRPHWKRMTIGIAVNTMAAATPFAFGYTNRMVVDDVLELGRWGKQGVSFSPDELPAKFGLLAIILGIIVSIHLLSMAGNWVFSYATVFVSQRFVFTLRKQLYEKLQKLQMAYFDQRATGKIMARVLDDVQTIQHHVTATLSSIVTHVMMFLIGVAVLFSINVKLATMAVVFVPTWALTYHFFGKKIAETARRLREKNSEIYAIVEEKISGVRVVKAFASEFREIRRYAHLAADFIRLALRQARLSQGLSFVASTVSIVGSGIILYIGALEVKKGMEASAAGVPLVDPLYLQYLGAYLKDLGHTLVPGNSGEGITPGDLLYFHGSVSALYGPIMVMVNLNATAQWVLVVLRRVFEVLDEPINIGDKEDAKDLESVTGEVEFRDVTLRYPSGGTPALEDVSVKIPAGSKVAIMGQSGAGKTSLVNLLMRFYETTEGQVLVDGQDVRDVTLKSLRKHISMVPQEIVMFTGTIAENIKYGRTDATARQVIRAAKEAELHGFIMSMPEKYETAVGEHGAKLSGGQRQRLAIAMSLLTDPRILILDDSTSALDAETEERIRNTLKTVMRNRTAFIITHRSVTASDADMILVLDRGELVEVGTHDELINKKDGAYARIVELQQRGQSLIEEGVE